MGVETKMVSENLRNANSMQIPQHRYILRFIMKSGAKSAPKFCQRARSDVVLWTIMYPWYRFPIFSSHRFSRLA